VEGVYLRALDALEQIFEYRPYLLGSQPTLADFGFFASMFRHFSLDPTPGRIMRERAPAVYEWTARLWNERASLASFGMESGIPRDWGPILDEIGAAYLPYLAANAEAWKARRAHFDLEVQGVRYRSLPTSRYRVWCLEQLKRHCRALPDAAQQHARTLLAEHGAWDPLWRVDDPQSGHDPEGTAPFAAGIEVFRRFS
jgi:hypothetical protein